MRLLLAFISLITTLSSAQADTPLLHRGVSVHFTFEGETLNLDQETSEARVIANLGFDFVRLTVSPDLYLPEPSEDKTKLVNDAVLKSVHAFEGQGLKVVIDLHATPKSSGRPAGTEEFTDDEALSIAYSKVAASLAAAIDQDGSVNRAFEPMNEPVLDCPNVGPGTATRWPALAVKLHDIVRKSAPHVTLIIEGGCWGGASGLAALSPAAFHDGNIIWSFHDYAPMLFTHQGASWVGGVLRYATDIPYPPITPNKSWALTQSAATIAASKIAADQQSVRQTKQREAVDDYFAPGHAKADLLSPFEKVKKWATAQHVPARQILFGEFGAIKGSAGKEPSLESRAAYLRAKREAAEAHGWGWAIWDWNGAFAILREDSATELFPRLGEALGLPAKK